MANLTRLEPFRELARFEPCGDMDEWFRRMALRPFLREGMEIEPQIKMDVKEADGKYLINA